MPYATIESLPANIKSAYSEKAQAAFMAAFNNVMAATKDEARAFAAAHSAAKKVDGMQEAAQIVEADFREAEWDTAYINNLPDASFAYIQPGGEKDEGGKTVPRSLRHFPYKDASGKVDLPHLRNALARAPQSPFGDQAMPKLKAAAKAGGVGEFAEANLWLDATFTEAPQLDEGSGFHKAKVTIIKPGISANGFYYSDRVLSGLVPLIEGAKAYIDHETKSEIKDRGSRSVKDLMGWYSDVYQGQEGEVRGMLNFAPGSERIVEMLKVNPALVGLSINAKGRASRGEVGGKRVMIAEAFDKLYSTDIVTEAAAGGEVTRMVASVTADIEDNEEEDTQTSEVKESMAEEDKLLADWLLAERSFEVQKKDEELGTIKWLSAEVEYGKKEAERKSAIEEAVKEIPEKQRDYLTRILEGKATEDIEAEVKSFREMLAADPPEKKNDTPAGSAGDSPKPGEDGYKRHFLG